MQCSALVQVVAFKDLPKGASFVEVIVDEDGIFRVEGCSYEKHIWQSFNAVQKEYDGEACNKGWVIFSDDQLVLPFR